RQRAPSREPFQRFLAATTPGKLLKQLADGCSLLSPRFIEVLLKPELKDPVGLHSRSAFYAATSIKRGECRGRRPAIV
ncbi:MAG TPA: hypothetical protein VNO70_19330, partial [Blastocatellia bacterium]|nr:hypothetical protein [Blastocatellia bacterium]